MFLSALSTAPTTPWWAVPSLTGLATLAGAGLAGCFALVLDKRRLATQKEQRWDKELREM
jgi:hypothetical protein